MQRCLRQVDATHAESEQVPAHSVVNANSAGQSGDQFLQPFGFQKVVQEQPSSRHGVDFLNATATGVGVGVNERGVEALAGLDRGQDPIRGEPIADRSRVD